MFLNLSYWEKNAYFNADVVIIGSGIVGLNAAITIKSANPKISVSVLERGFLPSGASTKNAGFACFGSISELIEQERSSGTDGLHQLISKRWNGLLKLRKLLGDDQIDFRNYGGYELFKPHQYTLAHECVAKISHFNTLIADIVRQENAFSLQDKKIKTFGFNTIETLIDNSLESQIDPGLMMKALLLKATSLGISVFSMCKVNRVLPKGNGVDIETEQGNFFSKKVLLTTNAFINELNPGLSVVPGRGQVVVTSPINNLKVKGTFHYEKGFYYFRNIGNRVLLGGGRNLDFEAEATTEFGETQLVQDALLKLLEEVIIPDTEFLIEHKWSGIMAFGPQLAPIIEEVKPDIFCAVRCNGMGIAIGSSTGEEAGEIVVKSL